jgi:hypothetical protein
LPFELQIRKGWVSVPGDMRMIKAVVFISLSIDCLLYNLAQSHNLQSCIKYRIFLFFGGTGV